MNRMFKTANCSHITEDNYKWEPSHISYPLPDKAIVGGTDSDGSIIYVARSEHSGIKLPAKAIPSKRACYISFNGLEILVERFEVLTGDSTCFSWEPSSQGKPIANALSTDKIGFEEIFVGRAPFSNSMTIGKIQPSHRCLRIPYNGKEHQIEHYEVLVYRKKPQMGSVIDFGHVRSPNRRNVSGCRAGTTNDKKLPQQTSTASKFEWTHTTSNSAIPPTAIFGGRDSNFSILFIGRCMHDGCLLPCKIIPNKPVARVTYNGVEIEKQTFEILLGSNSNWVACSNGSIPSNAFPGGYTKQGEVLYIGRTSYNGGLIVGRVHKSHRCIYVGHNGRECSLSDYEVLIED